MMAGVPRSSPPPLPPPPRGLIGNLGLLSYALMQLAGQAVDVTVITPCAELISTSVMNPNVWSERIWDTLKSFAPQRARDISRLLSVAIAKSLPVFTTESSVAWTDTTTRLQSHAFDVLSTPEGHAAIQDTVAAVIKTTQALGTPEVKAATSQATSAIKSYVQMLATPEGQVMLDDVHNWVSHSLDVASSAESSIFLFEVATHLCHVFDSHKVDDGPPLTVSSTTDVSSIPTINSNTLNGSSDKAHYIPVNGDDSMKKTRRHQSRKAALEASMLRKLGVREPMDEVEETLELPTDMTGVRGTANNELLSRAFESFDEGQEHEDQVARDDNGEREQWHVEQTHPTLRRRHHRQRLHQALRNSPKVHARPRALSKQYRHLQLSRDEGTALQTMTPMDRYAIKVLSMVVVVFVAVVLLIVLLALYRVLLV
ncbi:hypothetical protein H257_17000 [Aphanomyces astaci]|uniref:Uncharacterized protein n=1 Tax=Aphanomyces astaci TaxID=112090 RepID=W4FGL8_APHAT|nr:hypothetical protein H257_17000 [Aphanomyces astaci]ETV66565.1 hypothetical protein H257_17000 [Aphanomyces astaci]|eukprot:XP_009843936.1 hypothetical protein H257_17000 [Aphanomyces astaci]